MSEEFSPMIGFDANAYKQNGYANVKYGSDAALSVKFYDRRVWKDEFHDDAAGIYREAKMVDVVFCRMQAAGDRLSIHDQPATEEDKARFPKQWQYYLAGNAGALGGTPLDEIEGLAEDQEQRLRFYGIHSLEQLAAISDGQMSSFGLGARELKARAQIRLKEKADQEALEQAGAAHAENKALRELLAKQQEAIEALQAKVSDTPKRGRPAKDSQNTEEN